MFFMTMIEYHINILITILTSEDDYNIMMKAIILTRNIKVLE